jgi:hypothetical protein
MSTASTKKHVDPDAADLDTRALRVRGRGSNARKRLELPLAGIRKAAGKTQVDVAEASGMGQGDVSRIETQDDLKISTLKRYAEAIGARVDVAFEFPNGTRVYLASALHR